jgi:hypothetical protein
MRVLMVLPREWQDGGRTQQLDVGQVYDLPDGVGADLIGTGAAMPVDPEKARGLRPPESKPLLPPEVKARPRDAS